MKNNLFDNFEKDAPMWFLFSLLLNIVLILTILEY